MRSYMISAQLFGKNSFYLAPKEGYDDRITQSLRDRRGKDAADWRRLPTPTPMSTRARRAGERARGSAWRARPAA